MKKTNPCLNMGFFMNFNIANANLNLPKNQKFRSRLLILKISSLSHPIDIFYLYND